VIRRDPFSAPSGSGVFHLLAEEGERSARLSRAFAVLRIEARGGLETEADLLLLYRTVAGALRRCDRVQAVGGRELAAILTDVNDLQADGAANRVRAALGAHSCRWRARLGWACAQPGEAWQHAWRMAGALLVADGVIPAAA
jgi:hypothetical protein